MSGPPMRRGCNFARHTMSMEGCTRCITVEGRTTLLSRPAAIAGTSAITATLAAHTAIRHAGRTWGATHEEAMRSLPGDELMPEIDSQVTMAVTVDAPPASVWPWIVQMGADRAGLYSHTWLENGLLRLRIRNADRIHPEWQDLAVGSHIWLVPEGYPAPRFGPRVAAIEPNRYLVCTLGDDIETAIGTWQFMLEPQADMTRLLFRSRASATRPTATKMLDALVEPGYIYMDIGMLHGIKERAERAAPALHGTSAEARLAEASRGTLPARLIG